MPNRIIKESICKSEDIDNLSYFEEVLFYRLMVNCDDYGRFDGRTKIIKAFCFPLKDIKEKDIESGIRHLIAQGLICLYEVDNRQYIQLSSWDKHQQIRSKRSKYPGLDDENANMLSCDSTCNHVISDDISCNQMISDDSICPRNPIQSESESKSESNPKRTQASLVGESDLSDPVKEKLLEWLAYKKERKDSYGERGLQSLITQVHRHEQEAGSIAVINVIDLSMSNQWKGIIWEKMERPAMNTSPHGSEVMGWLTA